MHRILRVVPVVALAVASACGPFEPDPTGPTGPGGSEGPPPTTELAVPMRLGSTQPEESRGVAWTGDGVVVASWFTGRLDFDQGDGVSARTSLGGQDIGVAKYTSTGAFQWVLQIGGPGTEVPAAVAATPDGGVVVAGYASTGASCGSSALAARGGRDILIAKISAAGSCQWANMVGGSDDDEARAVAVDADGSVIVAGLFRGSADFDPSGGSALLVSRGGSDAFVARYAADGSLVGVSQGGGPEDDLFAAVMVADGGDVTVAGEIRGSTTFGSAGSPLVLLSVGGADAVIARYTALLGLRWAERVGGAGEDRATALAADPNGNILVAGSYEGVADLDPGAGAALLQSQGASDVFLARFEPVGGGYDGLVRSIGGLGSEGVTGLVRHISGRIIMTGYFQQTVDFDPGTGAQLVTAKGTGGAGDAFVYAFSSAGNYAWVVPIGGVVGGEGLQSIGYGLTFDDQATVWAVGRFYGRADFDPSDAATELTGLGDSDGWLSRYTTTAGVLVTSNLAQ